MVTYRERAERSESRDLKRRNSHTVIIKTEFGTRLLFDIDFDVTVLGSFAHVNILLIFPPYRALCTDFRAGYEH